MEGSKGETMTRRMVDRSRPLNRRSQPSVFHLFFLFSIFSLLCSNRFVFVKTSCRYHYLQSPLRLRKFTITAANTLGVITKQFVLVILSVMSVLIQKRSHSSAIYVLIVLRVLIIYEDTSRFTARILALPLLLCIMKSLCLVFHRHRLLLLIVPHLSCQPPLLLPFSHLQLFLKSLICTWEINVMTKEVRICYSSFYV